MYRFAIGRLDGMNEVITCLKRSPGKDRAGDREGGEEISNIFVWQMSDTHSGRSCYQSIQNWVKWLVSNHCFCPEKFDTPFDYAYNISCYISSPGTIDGSIFDTAEVRSVLRYRVSDRGPNTSFYVLNHLIRKAYGMYLTRFCHVGPESSIMEDILDSLQTVTVDFRALLACPTIYDSKKHIEKLGLNNEIPGLCSPITSKSPDIFMKCPVIWKGANGGVGSEGAGINMWSLLLLASLVGNNHIHCKSSSSFSQSLIKLMLKNAPPCVTPGDVIPLRTFHDQTREPEVIDMRAYKNRPEVLLRPINDSEFALNGTLSMCPCDEDNLLVEDKCHCAVACQWKSFLKCKKYIDIPANIPGHYQLIPERYYAVYHGFSENLGNLYVNETGVELQYDAVLHEAEDDNNPLDFSTGCHWNHLVWQESLKEEGWLILPMIWRTGALVVLDKDEPNERLGCLVPRSYQEINSMAEKSFASNYDHQRLAYNVLVNQEEDLQLLSPLRVLDFLLPPGTIVWIKHSTAVWFDLDKYLPVFIEKEESKRMIKGRLNVPLSKFALHGKVWVTLLQRRSECMTSSDIDYRHVQVDPWELSLSGPTDEIHEIHELLV